MRLDVPDVHNCNELIPQVTCDSVSSLERTPSSIQHDVLATTGFEAVSPSSLTILNFNINVKLNTVSD